MASRLSFFLWSSIPDEELRRAAAAGELSSAPKLQAQVKRMLADPKARRLATEFFGQWLGFYHFDQFKGVDTSRFPEFTDEVKSAMYDEAVSFFEYIVRTGPSGERDPLRRLHLPQQAAREVLRRQEGGQVQGRGGAGRRRQRLSARRPAAPGRGAHRDLGAAAHQPGEARRLGAAAHSRHADAAAARRCRLDSGRRQTLRRPLRAQNGSKCTSATPPAPPAICASIRWASRWSTSIPPAAGARSTPTASRSTTPARSPTDKQIAGVPGLLDYLQAKDDQVRRTLARKLIGYALGRTVQASDEPLIERMVQAGGNATFSQLAAEIVTSKQFRNRLGREDAAPAAVKTAAIAARQSIRTAGRR